MGREGREGKGREFLRLGPCTNNRLSALGLLASCGRASPFILSEVLGGFSPLRHPLSCFYKIRLTFSFYICIYSTLFYWIFFMLNMLSS